jgi:hypothetical protein
MGAMRHWLDLRRPPAALLFLVMAALAGAAAWLSFGLINLAMANYGFLAHHGLRALAEGGLVQALGICLRALAVVACYFGFKLIETELTLRYRRWIGRDESSGGKEADGD